MPSYRLVQVIDDFDDEDLHDNLSVLVRRNLRYLQKHPNTPRLYESGVRYQEEPFGQEDWLDIPSLMRLRQGDCLPLSTLVLRDDGTFAEMRELIPGDRIYGDGDITTVTDTAMTGEKPILAFELQNGAILRASPEHRLFLRDDSEIRAEDVKVGHLLKSPSSIPMGEPWKFEGLDDDDFAWLVGLYIADGWHEKKGYRFSISGDDANPKRGKKEQKERVEAIMQRFGAPARHYKKCVAVNHRELTNVMMLCGSRAPIKQLPVLRMSESQVRSVLLGLQTDCSTANSGTLTHGTVSPSLALQLRVLYRMLGQSVHIRRWDDHGGLGKNPIYRVTVRRPSNDEMSPMWQTRSKNFATSTKVLSIREEEPEECCDITTESGRFYLPESDLVVHNCEDLAAWRVAEVIFHNGVQARPVFRRRVERDGTIVYHILVRYPNGHIEDPSRILGMES